MSMVLESSLVMSWKELRVGLAGSAKDHMATSENNDVDLVS